MLCPSCQQALVEISAPPVLIDVCISGCKGIWFDRGELEKVLKHPAQAEQLMNSTGWEIQESPAAEKRCCPRCAQVALHSFHWGGQYPVELDLCPQCGGFWLDAGELLLVCEGLKAGEKLPQVRPVKHRTALASMSAEQILAWELVDDVAEVVLYFGPDLLQAGAHVAETASEILPSTLAAAGEAVLNTPTVLIEGVSVAAEAAGGLAEGVGVVAEVIAEGVGAILAGIFEFLASLS